MRKGYTQITLIYILVSVIWITLSDQVLFLFRDSIGPSVFLTILSSKGYLFVLITGLLIYNLIKNNDKRLRSSEKQYRTMYAGNNLPMWIYDIETLKFVSVNDAAVNNYGYSRQDFLSMTILDIRPEEDRDKVKISINHVSKNLRQSGTWKHIKKDGSQLHVLISSQRIWFNNKLHVMVTAQDISDKVTYEQRLNELNTELKIQKDKLSETQQLAKVAGWEFYLHSKELIWSNELYLITGVKPDHESKLFDLYTERIHPEDRPAMIKALDSLVNEASEKIDVSHRISFPDGKTRYVRHIARLEKENGKPYKVIGSMQDITELKVLEKEKNDYLVKLKEAVERYEMVSKATQDVIYEYDVAESKLVYSSSLKTLVNETTIKYVNSINWWRSLIHPADLKGYIHSHEAAIANKDTYWSHEYRIITGKGDYKYVCDQGYYLYNEVAEPVKLIGAIKDINELKRSHEENKRLADIITKVNNMVILLDTDHKITWVNKAFEDYTGFSLEHVLGKEPREFLSGQATSSETMNYIGQCKRNLETFSVELIHCIRDKQQWVRIEYTPLFDHSGKNTGYIAVHQNIDESKRKQERIANQNKVLHELAWISSHEVRKPVASILSLLDIVKDAKSDHEKEEIMELLEKCAKDLDEKVKDIAKRVSKETIFEEQPDQL